MSRVELTPQDIVPSAMADMWPESVPVHAVSVAAVIRPDGRQAIQVLHSSDAPIWVLLGMLECVCADLRSAWIDVSWTDSDEVDDE
jgi:hypothetical protein